MPRHIVCCSIAGTMPRNVATYLQKAAKKKSANPYKHWGEKSRFQNSLKKKSTYANVSSGGKLTRLLIQYKYTRHQYFVIFRRKSWVCFHVKIFPSAVLNFRCIRNILHPVVFLSPQDQLTNSEKVQIKLHNKPDGLGGIWNEMQNKSDLLFSEVAL